MTRIPQPTSPLPRQPGVGTPRLKMPAPAVAQPGVTGNPPLPRGRSVAVTPADRARLQRLGIDPDTTDLPANTAELLEQAGAWQDQPHPTSHSLAQQISQAQAAAMQTAPGEMEPPVPFNTPPVQYQETPLDSLPDQRKAYFERLLADGKQMEVDRHNAELARAKLGMVDPKLRQGIEQIQSIGVQQPMVDAKAQLAKNLMVEDDRQGDTYGGTSYPKDSFAGASKSLTHCPNCQHDLSQPVDVDPTEIEIEAWVQTLLGRKCFQQTFDLLSGKMQITFRNLTLQESDSIYQQLQSENDPMVPVNRADYLNQILRYRMLLSLQRVVLGTAVFPLPDGLSPETNPHAQQTWKLDKPANYAHPTLLPLIGEIIFGQVLTTESLVRTVYELSQKFNRLVARLEVLTRDPNFLSRTETPASSSRPIAAG